MLPGLHVRSPAQRKPGGQTRDPEGHREPVIQPVRQRVGLLRLHECALGDRSKGGDGSIEVHAPTRQYPHPLAPGHAGKLRPAGVEATGANRDIDRVDPGGKHIDYRLTGACGRLGELIGARHPVIVQDGSPHRLHSTLALRPGVR